MKFPPVVLLIFVLIVLGGLFFVFKPETQTTPLQEQPETANSENKQNAKTDTINTFELVIENNQLISGPEVLSVNKGAKVVINITSDAPEELHIHGYDESVMLEPNVPATLTFSADLSGRFPFELELSQTEIGILEVQPQ